MWCMYMHCLGPQAPISKFFGVLPQYWFDKSIYILCSHWENCWIILITHHLFQMSTFIILAWLASTKSGTFDKKTRMLVCRIIAASDDHFHIENRFLICASNFTEPTLIQLALLFTHFFFITSQDYFWVFSDGL